MIQPKLALRIAAPTILVSLLLLVLGATAAAYTYHLQATTAELLHENVESKRAAYELETTLEDLLALLRTGSSDAPILHQRIEILLQDVAARADKADERQFASELDQSFARYTEQWRAWSSGTTATAAAAIAAAEKMLATCRALRSFNTHEVEKSEAIHRETVRWVAWGLAGVGVGGAFAGLFLGYGMSRALGRSIHQLSVRIRDASNRLEQDVTTVTLEERGDLPQLHEHMQRLVQNIEKTVQQLQDREREVVRAEQLAAVGQLAAGAAHELRNPLTAIKMLLSTLREEAGAQGLSGEDFDVIEQELRRMERCLQNFLDFARPPRLECRPVDVHRIVERTYALLQGRAQNQQVQLQLDAPRKPVVVQADESQLQQLLVNLVLNALDAMPHGGRVLVRLSSPVHGHVELRVSDTGPGISEALLPRLFNPFVSNKETGLGLGLVVSRRIAEAHGGALDARNLPEGGACFILQLPLDSVGTADGQAKTPTQVVHANVARD